VSERASGLKKNQRTLQQLLTLLFGIQCGLIV